MIELKHLSKCPSVLNLKGLNLERSLNFCTDTRRFTAPGAFVAIPGAKVNPLTLLDGITHQGCELVVYQSDKSNEAIVDDLRAKHKNVNFLAVKDSVTFLQELTHHHVLDWQKQSPKNIVFAISGSNGKTTHKEMLAHIMNKIVPGKVVATEKNNNNHLGVPLTLLNVKKSTEFVILELGSNHPGEIKVLCDIARPNAGLTTNIGATHLEFFGSEEKVFEEEGYLYFAVKSHTGGKGFFLQNSDDEYLKSFAKTDGTISYGTGPSASAKVIYKSNGAQIDFQGSKLAVENSHITGEHNKLNLVTCAFIASHFYPQFFLEIVAAASSFRPTKNRSEWIQFEDKSVFLDAYNANPSSMKAALEGFRESVQKQGIALADTCVVLGDMNELGENAPRYHRDIGKLIGELGFPHVYFIGRYADSYQEGFPSGSKRMSSLEFKQEFRSECIKKYSIHFIKGSRSLQLESLFDIP